MPRSSDYLTTGETAELLGISRSTVSRRFDAGVFRGRVNPITGERMISRDSVLAFVRERGLPVDLYLLTQKAVILAAAGDALAPTVARIAAADRRIALETVRSGSQALILCARRVPDLLIVEEGLPDVDCDQVIRALKEQPETSGVTILCALAKPRRAQPAWGADAYAAPSAADDALRSDIVRLLDLPSEEEPPPRFGEYQRRWSRVEVNLPARVAVFRRRDPEHRAWGAAVVRDISQGGAFLANLRLDDGAIPAEPFRILIQVDEPPLLLWTAECQLVRLQSNGSLSAGVRFVNISESCRQKIAELAATG